MSKRGKYEEYARRRYAEGCSIEEIETETGVSSTTLYKWKRESLVPGKDMDEWERARSQRRSNIQRLKDLFERELRFVEEQPKGSISAPSMDALSKLGALVKRWEEFERAEAAAKEVTVEIDYPAVFLQNLEWLAAKLKDLDPAGLQVLAANFDALIFSYKQDSGDSICIN